jgi:16S rRNA (cytosine1402-N4)-methyltransferase
VAAPHPKPRRRSTPSGEHRPVLLDEVLAVLSPQPGQVVVDCTVGWAGHAAKLLGRIGPTGRLLGLDLDPLNLARARERLDAVGYPFTLYHGNFAGLPAVLAGAGVPAVDALLADLGMSSMQVDDPGRGFSYRRDGPLDMRMDPSRGRSAADLLATISEVDLCRALRELGDEPEAEQIAAAIFAARCTRPMRHTGDLVEVILGAVRPAGGKPWRLHPAPGRWDLHPAARTFQTLRLLVNRELENLKALLRVLPSCLRPGGRAAIIAFHSGEDRLVKASIREGLRTGQYARASPDPLRAGHPERLANPRSRSAKLRWAERNGNAGQDMPPPGPAP